MSDVLVLVPAHGEPVALTRTAWNATVDFLADHHAFHESLLEAWRRAPGVTVSDLQATRMAGLADHEADDPFTAAEDRDGLTRLARFCRDSGGFLVAGPEAMPEPAPPPEPDPEPSLWADRPLPAEPVEAEPPALGVAVNRAYADRSTRLADGDEVAFIPPVSGGAAEPIVALTDDAVDLAAVVALVADPGAGAIATFSGTVRDSATGSPCSGTRTRMSLTSPVRSRRRRRGRPRASRSAPTS